MSIDNARLIENAVLVSLPDQHAPKEEAILELATRLRQAFPLSDDDFASLIKRLHAKLAITMDTGVVLLGEEEHTPWLSSRKAVIDPFYWQRFLQLLQRKDWPPKVLSTLNSVTDNILDLLGDPAKPGSWKRRGLVIGDVQSGKTATYTALSCKAGDAGYRLIVLLTGTLESLRRQTQERLDEGFVGFDSSGILRKIRNNRAVGVGTLDARRSAGVFTSRDRDFSKTLVNSLGIRINSIKEPVLVVVKKNRKILENLEKWLTEYNAGDDGKIDVPLLLIDDEADSASVNTNPLSTDPTEINKRIRALLALFKRSSYIGFTATPFANIFINPDSENDMLGDDLFPRDFIYTLDPPTNYVGPVVMFGDEPRDGILEPISDAESVFPSRHKCSWPINDLPQSLRDAVTSFVIANTIRDLRGDSATHRSMLVNVSRFTAVQDQVAVLINSDLNRIQQDIRNYSQLDPAIALRNKTISEIHQVWRSSYNTKEFAWEGVQRALLASALPIVVKAVNQRTGAASLDYASNRENGLRVIAIGGNSLSRGLTLEGLSTSYFYRNSQMYDTLLQMGRWFGYRDNYSDLCKVWLSEDAIQWYSHITAATEELRFEVKRMRRMNATPREFGLKVRAHPDSLIVTAQNKMRLAHTIERVISISTEAIESTRLKSSRVIISANKQVVANAIANFERAGIACESSEWNNPIWREVPKELVSALIRNFEVHPLNVAFQSEDLADYFTNTTEPKLQKWDVVLPNGGEPEIIFVRTRVRPAKRFVLPRDNGILVSGRNMRVGSRGIEREGLPSGIVREINDQAKLTKKNVSDHAFRERRPRPLLLIHVLAPYTRDGNGVEVPFDTGGEELIALGLSMPKFDDSDVAKRVKYRVNLVEWRAMLEESLDDDLPENDDDAA
ncbi:endonuclease [Candidatus Koribacter versatilis Ellin345]|uniref:Endonuclease n=1 Tax=Koribacter versatilis (strain Ellin345) TaxID=204669 RepID=Q1IIN3_KORVE|nr:Z1 domain-containing protein [Candidatus Koribacter versatilis]ABF43267.1 endonuclease [Candidatus Koribacter versatilis Ellin345]